MKRIIRSSLLILLCAAFAFGAAACNKAGESEAPRVQKTAEEVYQEVYEVSGFGTMTPVSKRDYMEIYTINPANFVEDDFVWYISENPSLNADEVFIARLEKESYADVLISLLQKHIDQRLAVAKDYSPDEASKLEQAEICTAKNSSGYWVYYCIGEQYTKMMGVIRTDIG